MKIFHNKVFALVLLGIIKDSLDYIYSRNDQGESSFYIEKSYNFLWHQLLHSLQILSALAI